MCAVTEEQIKKLFSYDIEAEKHAINMMLSGNDQEISSALQNRINLVAKKEAAIQAFYCILTEHERLVSSATLWMVSTGRAFLRNLRKSGARRMPKAPEA